MQENNIKKAIDGIFYSEDTKERIRSRISQKQAASQIIEERKTDRGWGLSGRLKAVAVLACLVLAIVIANIENSSPYNAQVLVYAKTHEGEKKQVVLPQGKKVELEQIKTPVGDAYTFEVQMEDNYTYCTAQVNTNEESIEVYQDSNIFYCVTVYDDEMLKDDNIQYVVRSDDMDKNSGTIEVTIYNQEGEALEKKIIQFERLDDGSMTFVWD